MFCSVFIMIRFLPSCQPPSPTPLRIIRLAEVTVKWMKKSPVCRRNILINFGETDFLAVNKQRHFICATSGVWKDLKLRMTISELWKTCFHESTVLVANPCDNITEVLYSHLYCNWKSLWQLTWIELWIPLILISDH